jgi:cytochrome c2
MAMKIYGVALAFIFALGFAGESTGRPSKPISQDVARGRAIFNAHCANCHDNSEHMLNDTGPALFGVVGRHVGSVEGYNYSPALQKANSAGDVWSEAALDRFLRQPYAMHPGTEMGMNFDKRSDRKAIIAYLKTLHARQ